MASMTNMWQAVVWWVGLLLQLAGVGVAFWGVAANQEAYLAPGETWMLQWTVTLGRHIRHVALQAWRWIAQKKQINTEVRAAPGSASSQIGYVTVTLRDPWDPGASTLTVEERLKSLEQRLLDTHHQVLELEANRGLLSEATRELSDSLVKQGDELRVEVRDSVGRLATKGTRLAAKGLVMTAFGMAMSAVVQGPWTWR